MKLGGVLLAAPIVIAYGSLLQFEHCGQSASLPPRVKASDSRHWRLVTIVDKSCPCSFATLENLRQMRSREELDRVDTVLVVEGCESADTAKRIFASRVGKDQSIQIDPGFRLARQFGATISGTTYLINPSGKCVFRGGITDARGVQGRSTGAELIRKLITEHLQGSYELPVLGCQIPGIQLK